MKRPISFLLTLILTVLLISPGAAVPSYAATTPIAIKADSFSSGSGGNVGIGTSDKLLQMTGAAAVVDTAIRIVPDTGGQTGTVVKSGKIRINDGFSTYFQIKISKSSSGSYADGMAFIVYDSTGSESLRMGQSGGGLGYAGLTSAVAIEFDDYLNTGTYPDPNANHIAIMTGATAGSALSTDHTGSNAATTYNYLLDQVVNVWVDYKTDNTLTVTVSPDAANKSAAGSITISKNIDSFLQGKDVFVGFTAATGGSYANHDLLKWYFQNSYVSGGLSSSGDYAQAASTISITLPQSTNPTQASIALKDASGTILSNQNFILYLDGVSTGALINTGDIGTYDYPVSGSLINGTHTIQVVDPTGGATKSQTFTIEQYAVNYYGNGADGTPVLFHSAQYNTGAAVTVIGAGSLIRGSYVFQGWNTKADGTGTPYAAGDLLNVSGNENLYAQWLALSASSGTASAYQSGAAVAVDTEISVKNQTTTYSGATVTITNLKSGDQLTQAAVSGIAASYDESQGVLTLSGNASGSQYETALQSVSFLTASSDTTSRAVSFRLSAPVGDQMANRHYAYVPGTVTWGAAKVAAESSSYQGFQGYLATITSQEENARVNSISGQHRAWLGSSDDPAYVGFRNTEGDWHWVTGPEAGTHFSYSNWRSTQPDNWAGGAVTNSEDFGHMYEDGTWNDVSAYEQSVAGYVIEYGGYPLLLQATRTVSVIALPGAPTSITAVAGDRQATVDFTAPVSNGGGTITEYLVTASLGNITATGSGTTVTISGLTNGQTYSFAVKAKNEAGYGTAGTSASIGLPSTVSFNSNGGSAVAPITNVAIGAMIMQPANPTKAGFAFGQWYKESSLTSLWTFDTDTVTGDAILYASWTASSNTQYKVEHYQQDLAGSSYVRIDTDTQTLSGTTGAIVTAAAKNYTGFTENTTHSSRAAIGTIAADGSLILKLYYDWTTHSIQFDTNGGSTVTSVTGIRYGSTIAAVSATVKSGYNFGQWYKEASLTTPWDFATDTVTGDAILYAGWTRIPRNSNSATPLPTITSTESGSQLQPTLTQTVTQIGGFSMTVIRPDETQILLALDQQNVPGTSILVKVPASQKNSLVTLSGDTLSRMQQQDASLVVQAGGIQVQLPSDAIDLSAAARQLGQDLPSAKMSVGLQITEPSKEMRASLESAASAKQFQILTEPVQFQLIAVSAGNSAAISRLESSLFIRIPIPAGVDPNSVTTAVEVAPDGSLHHVPTKIVSLDGTYYAQLTGLMTGVISLITNHAQFSDTQNHWAQAVIDEMASRMIVAGYGNRQYHPENDMTRAEFSAILIKATGLPVGIGDNPFRDIESYRWYLGYVETAKTYGLLNGISETTFGAKGEITRQQAMAMLARTMDLTGLHISLAGGEVEQTLAQYRDGAAASDYAREAIVKLLKAGVISGRGDQTLALRDTVTRAEVAVMMKNLLEKSGLI